MRGNHKWYVLLVHCHHGLAHLLCDFGDHDDDDHDNDRWEGNVLVDGDDSGDRNYSEADMNCVDQHTNASTKYSWSYKERILQNSTNCVW